MGSGTAVVAEGRTMSLSFDTTPARAGEELAVSVRVLAT
jgi:hypothetical protein